MISKPKGTREKNFISGIKNKIITNVKNHKIIKPLVIVFGVFNRNKTNRFNSIFDHVIMLIILTQLV